MTRTCLSRLTVLATILLIGSASLLASDTPPAAPEKGTGDLWEVTSQMSMEGAPVQMPAQTHEVCGPKEWKEPPSGMDERQKCQVSDFKSEGSKVTWKMRCAGPPSMAGDGEITRTGADAYTGSIKFASPGGSMNLKLTGRRVGACDLAVK